MIYTRSDSRRQDRRYFASLIPDAEFVPLPSRNHIPLEHEPAWQQFLDAFKVFTSGDGVTKETWEALLVRRQGPKVAK